MECRFHNATTNTWIKTCCYGYAVDLLSKMVTRIHLKVDLYLVKDGFWGSYQSGTWNGVIGDVYYEKVWNLIYFIMNLTSVNCTDSLE